MSHDTGYTTNADLIQIQVPTDATTCERRRARSSLRRVVQNRLLEAARPVAGGYNINGVYILPDDTALTEAGTLPVRVLGTRGAKTTCPGAAHFDLTLTNMTPTDTLIPRRHPLWPRRHPGSSSGRRSPGSRSL
jgi:hypothetical protein